MYNPCHRIGIKTSGCPDALNKTVSSYTSSHTGMSIPLYTTTILCSCVVPTARFTHLINVFDLLHSSMFGVQFFPCFRWEKASAFLAEAAGTDEEVVQKKVHPTVLIIYLSFKSSHPSPFLRSDLSIGFSGETWLNRRGTR